MARTVDRTRLRTITLARLGQTGSRFTKLSASTDYLFVRWVASMTAVEAWAIWERYAEDTLVANINAGVGTAPRLDVAGARALIRNGRQYFDFRSTKELVKKATAIIGAPHQPFQQLTPPIPEYLDTLGAIRNYVVHQSLSALATYRTRLSVTFGIKSKPAPDEFLNAKDFRKASVAPGKPRILVLLHYVEQAIKVC
jgi:hypothetical protein